MQKFLKTAFSSWQLAQLGKWLQAGFLATFSPMANALVQRTTYIATLLNPSTRQSPRLGVGLLSSELPCLPKESQEPTKVELN